VVVCTNDTVSLFCATMPRNGKQKMVFTWKRSARCSGKRIWPVIVQSRVRTPTNVPVVSLTKEPGWFQEQIRVWTYIMHVYFTDFRPNVHHSFYILLLFKKRHQNIIHAHSCFLVITTLLLWKVLKYHLPCKIWVYT